MKAYEFKLLLEVEQHLKDLSEKQDKITQPASEAAYSISSSRSWMRGVCHE